MMILKRKSKMKGFAFLSLSLGPFLFPLPLPPLHRSLYRDLHRAFHRVLEFIFFLAFVCCLSLLNWYSIPFPVPILTYVISTRTNSTLFDFPHSRSIKRLTFQYVECLWNFGGESTENLGENNNSNEPIEDSLASSSSSSSSTTRTDISSLSFSQWFDFIHMNLKSHNLFSFDYDDKENLYYFVSPDFVKKKLDPVGIVLIQPDPLLPVIGDPDGDGNGQVIDLPGDGEEQKKNMKKAFRQIQDYEIHGKSFQLDAVRNSGYQGYQCYDISALATTPDALMRENLNPDPNGGDLVNDDDNDIDLDAQFDSSKKEETTEIESWQSKGGQIYFNNEPIFLKGINWYGFETKAACLIGLYSEGSYSQEKVKSLDEIFSFLAWNEFNAIRFPLSLDLILNGKAMNSPCSQNWSIKEPMKNKTRWEMLEILLITAAKYGIVILFDMHVLSPEDDITDLWYNDKFSPQDWITGWKLVLAHVHQHWNLLGIDIKNEPHGKASWVDWKAFVEQCIYESITDFPAYRGLFFVEGVQFGAKNKNYDDPYEHFWGANFMDFKMDPSAEITFDNYPSFLEENVHKRNFYDHSIEDVISYYNAKIVYSPHIYGPEVYNHQYFQNGGRKEWKVVWDSHYGWIQGITEKNVCVGEWGGTIPQQFEGGKEIQALAEWMVKNCITNFFWWCLNPYTEFSGSLMNDEWNEADSYILALLKYVQKNPTKFIVNYLSSNDVDGPGGDFQKIEVCTKRGAFTSPMCNQLFL